MYVLLAPLIVFMVIYDNLSRKRPVKVGQRSPQSAKDWNETK